MVIAEQVTMGVSEVQIPFIVVFKVPNFVNNGSHFHLFRINSADPETEPVKYVICSEWKD